jgi:hypothetical protein
VSIEVLEGRQLRRHKGKLVLLRAKRDFHRVRVGKIAGMSPSKLVPQEDPVEDVLNFPFFLIERFLHQKGVVSDVLRRSFRIGLVGRLLYAYGCMGVGELADLCEVRPNSKPVDLLKLQVCMLKGNLLGDLLPQPRREVRLENTAQSTFFSANGLGYIR